MKKVKLDLACGNDDLRPTMQYVKVTKQVMVATNAHILAVVPTKDLFDDELIAGIPENGMLIHREDFKKMGQFDFYNWKQERDVIRLISSKKRDALIEVETEENIGKFPNWEAVIPEKRDANINQVGLNFSLAYDLQKALGFDSCALTFSEGNKPVYITDAKDPKDESFGIIMPVLVD